MRLYLSIIGLFVLLSAPTAQEKTLYPDAYADSAYTAILNLEFDQASQWLELGEAANPGNLFYTYLEDYVDIIPVIVNEDEDAYDAGRDRKSNRLALLKRANADNPWRDFCIGEIYLRWAIADYKMGHEWRAAMNWIRANKRFEANKVRHPQFSLTDKSLGLIQSLMGALPVPKYLKWVSRQVSGIDGDVEIGYGRMERVLESGQTGVFRDEVIATMAYLNLHVLKKPEKAYAMLSLIETSPEKSPLSAFIRSNVAMRTGRNDIAIDILAGLQKSHFDQFPYLNLMLGEARLYRLEPDADLPILSFLEKYPGTSHRKRAYERLYWHALIFNPEKADQWKKGIQDVDGDWTDADRLAAFEAEQLSQVDLLLLKARLLFDGSYLQSSLDMLDQVDAARLTLRDHLEYQYRMARVYQGLEDFDRATVFFKNVIDQGIDAPEYYACNAALQLGIINESLEHYNFAIRYYEQCLDIQPAAYQRSLHMQAKAGLSRLKSRSSIK